MCAGDGGCSRLEAESAGDDRRAVVWDHKTSNSAMSDEGGSGEERSGEAAVVSQREVSDGW